MTTDLRCPICQRWLAEVGDYARMICPKCGAEVTYRSKLERQRTLAPISDRVVTS